MREIMRLPLGNNGLPCVTRRQLDNACEQLIRRFDPGIIDDPHPMDIDAFAEHYLELNMDFRHLTCDMSVLGMMIFDGTEAVPFYNKALNRADTMRVEANTVLIEADLLRSSSVNRYRFTLAHECSHALWHEQFFRGMGKNRLYACRVTDIFGKQIEDERLCSDLCWTEWQANKSASALLMPRTSVYRLMDRAKLNCRDAKEQLEMIRLIRNEYGVSEEAAFYRIKDLGYRTFSINTAQLKQIYSSTFLFPQVRRDRI